MGNSYTALSNNLAGIHHNPAGLGLIRKGEISLGFNRLNQENDARLFNTTSMDELSDTWFNGLGMVVPFKVKRGSFVIGFSYNRVKDFARTLKFNGYNSADNSFIQFLTANDPDIAYELGLSYEVYDENDNYIGDETLVSGNLNQSGGLIEEGSIDSYSFSGALEIGRNLFAGVTLDLFSGDYGSRRNYMEEDVQNIYGTGFLLDPADINTDDFRYFQYSDKLDWEINGFGLKAGVLYKMNRFIQFGASLKIPTTYEIKEHYEVNASSGFANARFQLDEIPYSASLYKIKTPLELNIGVALRSKLYVVSADIQYINYDQMEFTSGLSADDRFYNNREIEELFRNVTNLSIGAEYLLVGLKTKIRGGFIYRKSPYKNDPAKYDKKYLTFGAGILLGQRLTLDMAYMYGWWEDFGDNYESGVSRTYQKLEKKHLAVTAAYRL